MRIKQPVRSTRSPLCHPEPKAKDPREGEPGYTALRRFLAPLGMTAGGISVKYLSMTMPGGPSRVILVILRSEATKNPREAGARVHRFAEIPRSARNDSADASARSPFQSFTPNVCAKLS